MKTEISLKSPPGGRPLSIRFNKQTSDAVITDAVNKINNLLTVLDESCAEVPTTIGSIKSGNAFLSFSRPPLVFSENKSPTAYKRKTEANKIISGFCRIFRIFFLRLPSTIQFSAISNCDTLNKYRERGRQQTSKARLNKYTLRCSSSRESDIFILRQITQRVHYEPHIGE